MEFEPVIGVEVHAEMETQSKMFCSCPVVDPTEAEPNAAVCPVCTGMPGVLPVVNGRAVEYALRVALALGCEIAQTSIFARKNYFYPDLPKGYQISQYEQPLARNGSLAIQTAQGEKIIRIRRVHLEEDTGKLTHVTRADQAYTLVDLNRAGVPLLEIVTEPDLRSAEEVRLYGQALRSLLRYLGVNSGELEKGVLRIEPNVSVRRCGAERLGTRVEIKNLNSFRAIERSIAYEIQRQVVLLEQGGSVRQETVGWDVAREVTFTQRVKEGEEDYRYFPEPDLPPLVLDRAWIEEIRLSLPELPAARQRRLQQQYGLSDYDAGVLAAERAIADFYEQAVAAAQAATPKAVANWLSGELFSLLRHSGDETIPARLSPEMLAALVDLVARSEINVTTAKSVLAEMYAGGRSAGDIIQSAGLQQITDSQVISSLVAQVLDQNPTEVEAYLSGKETVSNWLLGQVMRLAGGKASPQLILVELTRQLSALKK